MRKTWSWLVFSLTIACVKPDPNPGYTPAWEPFDPEGEGWVTTDELLVVSDCQLHNLYSQAIPERNLSSEAMVGTAIRPPQLDLFSADVLRWILERGAPNALAVLHLGDALDLACEGEFETFLSVMNSADKPWLMAPGNHDSYYFGVYDPQDTDLWRSACHEAGQPFTKDRFIRRYVAALLAQDDAGFSQLAEALGLQDHRGEPGARLADRLPLSFEWRADPDTPGFLKAIAWNLDTERPWRSFIVQAADLAEQLPDQLSATGQVPAGKLAGWAIMLDSCQYMRRPELAPNAWQIYPIALSCGYTGEMLPDQLRVVRAWLDESAAVRGHVFMCHHPFDDLAPRSKSSLGYLWREYGVALLVSGHTHAGYFAHHDLGEGVEEIELNLASTTDWPMEWRTLRGYIDYRAQKFFIRSERHILADEIRHEDGYFDPGWEVPPGAPDDYRRYRQGEAETGLLLDFALAHHLMPYWLPQPRIRPNAGARRTEELVKDTLLWTYFRLLQYFPTDTARGEPDWPERCRNDRQTLDKIMAVAGLQDAIDAKIALLKDLEAFERTRHSRDPASGQSTDEMRARFKVCQAAWASRFEAQSGRQLRVEDDLIHVDWDRQMERRARRLGDHGTEH